VNCQITTGGNPLLKDGYLCLDSAKIVQITQTKRDYVDCQVTLGIMGEMLMANDSTISDQAKIIEELKCKNVEANQINFITSNQLAKSKADFKKERLNKNIWQIITFTVPVILGALIIIYQ